jgi:hypothetical protein
MEGSPMGSESAGSLVCLPVIDIQDIIKAFWLKARLCNIAHMLESTAKND